MNIPILDGFKSIHFTGIGGIGMSALAQLLKLEGFQVTGSDRSYDNGRDPWIFDKFKRQDIQILPQNKSTLSPTPDCLVITRAIEGANPELVLAEAQNIPIIKHSELLSSLVHSHQAVAVSGTSGKSTTTAMVAQILEFAGKDPTVILGAFANRYESSDYLGNLKRGEGDLIVAEVDESDGSVKTFQPEIAVLTNISKDHFEIAQLKEFFQPFLCEATHRILNAECSISSRLAKELDINVLTFGGNGLTAADDLCLERNESRFKVGGTSFRLSIPGHHNVQNALCSIAVARCMGISDEISSQALEQYGGLGRRWNILGSPRDIDVVDDFAHSPVKIAGALKTAHLGPGKVHAVFQPHGYGPTKFMWDEYIEVFSSGLNPEDSLYLLNIYDVGGTANRTVSSEKLANTIRKQHSGYVVNPESRSELKNILKDVVSPGDMVLVMGARDHSLTELASEIVDYLGD